MRRLILLFCSLLTAGCASLSITGPATYETENLAFSVPAGWKVTSHGMTDGCPYAFIEGPGQAVVSIQAFPSNTDPGVERFAKEFSHRARAVTPIGKISPPKYQTFQERRFGNALKETFVLTYMGVDVPHTRTYRKRTGGKHTYYVLTQMANEDASTVEPGFRQILNSLSVGPGPIAPVAEPEPVTDSRHPETFDHQRTANVQNG